MIQDREGILPITMEPSGFRAFTMLISCLNTAHKHFHLRRSSRKHPVWILCETGTSITFLLEDAGCIPASSEGCSRIEMRAGDKDRRPGAPAGPSHRMKSKWTEHHTLF